MQKSLGWKEMAKWVMHMDDTDINLIFLGGKIDDNLYKLLKTIDYIEYPDEFEEKLREINDELLKCVRIRGDCYHKQEELYLDE